MTDNSFLLFPFFTTDRQIPTALSYVDGDEYYGNQAKAFLVRNPTNTVAYFKDFLGQEYVHMPSKLVKAESRDEEKGEKKKMKRKEQNRMRKPLC